jgi:hypothetical protein
VSIFYFRNSLLILCFKEYSKYISKGSYNNIRGGLYEYTPEVICFLRSINPQYKKINRYMIITQGQIWIYISKFVIQITIKKSVINMGIRFYNKVAIHIKKLEEYKPYKREMKSFLIHHVFYSVEEFLFCWLML